MISSLFLFLLFAETVKSEAPKPKTAPLPELAAARIQRDDAQSETLKMQYMQIQQRRQATIDAACKAAGLAKCALNPEGNLLVEAKE